MQTHAGLIRTMNTFSPFVILVNGMMVKEALVVLATLIRLMAAKIGGPPNFQNKYDGCMHTFLAHHVMRLPNGCIVIARHNEIRDEIIHLTR